MQTVFCLTVADQNQFLFTDPVFEQEQTVMLGYLQPTRLAQLLAGRLWYCKAHQTVLDSEVLNYVSVFCSQYVVNTTVLALVAPKYSFRYPIGASRRMLTQVPLVRAFLDADLLPIENSALNS